MKKPTYLSIILIQILCVAIPVQTVRCASPAQRITRVEPLSWWVGMRTPLTLMFSGDDLRDSKVTVEEEGLEILKIRNAESDGYLFVDVAIAPDARAGEYTFLFRKGASEFRHAYRLEARRRGSAGRSSFSPADMIYLLMPDRFANGDPSNDSTPDTSEKADRTDPSGRHGGDLAGMIRHLDYIADLGATAIWSTPLLTDNEPSYSYHGYACSDYYRIDPRFGDNALYRTFVAESHRRGLKVIMDIVTNHCGHAHRWMTDPPYADWIHRFDTYTPTSHLLSTAMDPNASARDRVQHESGWFDTSMPDMNLRHPDVLQYFKQWAIWWIEYADLDGLRVDTYPYNEKQPMSEWCRAVRDEYPAMNIVGECWTLSPSQLAYWDGATDNRDGFRSHLPSVMDFPLMSAIRRALSAANPDPAGDGLSLIYQSLSHDYLFADPRRLLIMAANHDMERIADAVGRSPEKAKLVATLLATLRGTPQIFSGDELMFVSSDPSQGHSTLRVDFPGGWPSDTLDLFTPRHRTAVQQDVFNHYRTLFTRRKTEPVLHTGRTTHFAPHDNTYAYIRHDTESAILILINASTSPHLIDWPAYREILDYFHPVGEDFLTGEHLSTATLFSVAPLGSLVIKFHRRE